MTKPAIEIRHVNGEFDEIVATDAFFHMERMAEGQWWFCVESGGERVVVNFRADQMIVERDE